MTQDRPPPAYQEYPASMMASIDYRTMSLAARGLLYSMRNECWVNGSVPADLSKLARVLGFDAADVQRTLPEVMPFFDTDGAGIFSPELEAYREKLAQKRERQAEGGRKGADMTNGARAARTTGDPSGKALGNPSGSARPPRRIARGLTRGSLVQNNPVQTSPIQASDGGSNREWLNDYERASRGE